MEKKLAIKGHPTRGKEVIELLVMMGGTNPFSDGMVIGNKATNCYYISEDTATKYISWDYIGSDEINEYKIFTLEEFLEKYPYKVGDKVVYEDDNDIVVISEIKWDNTIGDIFYSVKRTDEEDCFLCPPELLKPYKKTNMNMNENKVESTGFMQMGKIIAVIFNSANYEDEVELQLGDYEIDVRDGKTYAVRKKLVYPKTYKECCDVLGIDTMDNDAKGYKHFLVIQFQELFIARNAYWKIAGEQMGLGKSWEPDWSTEYEIKYVIEVYRNNVRKNSQGYSNTLLAFPTEEMRDAFYDNFKELIEQCKELL